MPLRCTYSVYFPVRSRSNPAVDGVLMSWYLRPQPPLGCCVLAGEKGDSLLCRYCRRGTIYFLYYCIIILLLSRSGHGLREYLTMNAEFVPMSPTPCIERLQAASASTLKPCQPCLTCHHLDSIADAQNAGKLIRSLLVRRNNLL